MNPQERPLPNSSLPPESPFPFRQLIVCEEEQLRLAGSRGGREDFDCEVADPGAADEPWLAFTNRDRVGLALSGGGIRSATFNLGVLQALQEKGLLSQFDYVATVSGGGYVGGFWTAWRLRSKEKARRQEGESPEAPLLFPKPTEKDLAVGQDAGGSRSGLEPLRDQRERPEIRHLREFSRFLMPRLGVLEVEMWNGVVAVLGGLLPSLVFVAALTSFALLAWIGLVNGLVDAAWPWAAAGMAVLTAVLHVAAERGWRSAHPAERAEVNDYSIYVVGTFAALISGAGVAVVRWLWHPVAGSAGLEPLGWSFGTVHRTLSAVYAPAAAWAAVAVVLLVARFIQFAGGGRGGASLFLERSLDRTIARCLAPAILWTGLGLVWQWTFRWTIPVDGAASSLIGGAATGGTALGLGAVFALLRRWLESAVKSSSSSKLVERLKPMLPKLVANLAVLAFVAFMAQILMLCRLGDAGRWGVALAVCAAVVMIILWLLDPSRIGLHDFYRGRIARCFLGAAHPGALKPEREPGYNRFTHERALDDFPLGDLHRATVEAESDPARASVLPLRPIHLVCCAANNLKGDHLATLYRGARSAVLSQRGLSLGNQTRLLPELGFSSALTASASAFNSQMGAISMSFGPAVSFLMVALNLRLGLWLPHPSGGKPLRPWFPGRLFLRELLGRTLSSNPSHPEAPSPDYVHLSDGAHFENFGFYELVRRHCRYILLCDCGADPGSTFDDFATALRRVREDFGVEVEIDFSPLRPDAEGRSAQHVAVGTIHYDGLGGSDKGTLLYFKPTLTGDEPCDVAQYRRMNPEFPQQTTADQFYDEAQWESYRRLGEHAAHVVFRFADDLAAQGRGTGMGDDRRSSAEGIFYRAARQWKPGGRDSDGQQAALAARATSLESAIRDGAPLFLRAEFFPEVRVAADTAVTPEEENRALFYLMQVSQIMEDAWNLCHLGTDAQHPVNEGWMAYIGRWAVTPSFRRWWPLLSSMYSDPFRRFIGSRFQLNLAMDPADPAYVAGRVQLKRVGAFDDSGLAMREWNRCGRAFASHEASPGSHRVDRFELWFSLEPRPGSGEATRVQVGLAAVEVFHEGDAGIARLSTQDFFIPGSFKGCGFTESLLDHLIHHYAKMESQVVEMRVRLESSHGRRDPNSRLSRVHLIGFFKSRYFVYRRKEGDESTNEIEELARDVLSMDARKPRAATAVRVT